MPDRDGTPSNQLPVSALGAGSQRLDKWLWYARVTKSRSLAATLIERGRIRVNSVRIQKPSHTVKPDDVVTASVGKLIRVLKVVSPGTRRGPAVEARTLFEDLTPVSVPNQAGATSGADHGESAGSPGPLPSLQLGSGRPNKKERRQIKRFKGQGS